MARILFFRMRAFLSSGRGGARIAEKSAKILLIE
jgi:hypothetical protein